MNDSTALAVRQDNDFKLGLEPSTIEKAMELSVSVAKSKMFGITTPESALVRIMAGRNLGLPAMVSLQRLYDFDGKVGLYSDLIQALVQRHPMTEYFRLVETTDEKASYVAKRKGDPETPYTFTIEDARKAGLLDKGGDNKGKSAWNAWTKDMLRARCITKLAKIVCPEASMGLPSVEELVDGDVVTVGPDGEVIDIGGVKPASAPAAPLPKDYAAEVAALRALVEKAKTPADFKAAREALEARSKEIPDMQIEPTIKLYNERREAAKKAAEATKAGASAT